MSKFITSTLNELLKLKNKTIVDYFKSLNEKNRKSFFRSHTEVIKTAKNFKQFIENDNFELIRPYVSEDPKPFAGLLKKHEVSVAIPTKRSPYWGETTRQRQVQTFHYEHPELTIFSNGADVKEWFKQAPADLKLDSLRYVLKNVVQHHAANPAAAFGSVVRGCIRQHHISQLTVEDFDILLTDGDTLLNELFNAAKFKEYVSEDRFPSIEFVDTLEMNCTLAAMSKDRSSRHAKRVAKNLRRAKMLGELKELQRS